MSIPEWSTGGVGPELAELSPWDTLTLGGIKLPGRARLRVRRGRKHDRKSSPGVDGETFTDQGAKPCEFDITITVWNPQQMQELVDALDKLLPAPKKASPATSAATPGPYVDQRASSPTPSAVGQLLQQVNAGQLMTGNAVDSPYPDAFGTDTTTGNYLAFLNAQNAQTSSGTGSSSTANTPRGQTLKPLSISHPSLARLRPRAVIIVEEENFQPGSERGTFEWRARAVEWMGTGKAKVLGTPTGTTANPAAVPVSPDLPVSSPSSTDVGP